MWEYDKEANKCLVHQNLTKASRREQNSRSAKGKERLLLKYIPASESVPPQNDHIAAPGLEEEGCRWKIEPDGIVGTKLSDKSELTVNYKIAL